MPNISRNKDNQTMKFCPLLEYKMRNIFIEKSYKKSVPCPFLKNINWAYLWINSQNLCDLRFYCYPSWNYQILLKVRVRQLAFTSYKPFKISKVLSWFSLPVSFSASVLKKNISPVILYKLIKFHGLSLPLLLKILGNTCICFSVCDVINFKTNLPKKSGQKNLRS